MFHFFKPPSTTLSNRLLLFALLALPALSLCPFLVPPPTGVERLKSPLLASSSFKPTPPLAAGGGLR